MMRSLANLKDLILPFRKGKVLWLISLFILHISCIHHVPEEERVYITNTGMRYHSADCIYLGKSKTPIALSDAIAKGFYPCRYCLDDAERPAESQQATFQDSSRSDTVVKADARAKMKRTSNSTQCHGITKKGLRCKRRTTNSNGYCYQHQDQQ